MSIIEIIIIAVGLSMDAFAVSVTAGSTCKKSRFNHALKIAAAFGFFQAVMPIAGWLAGVSLLEYIKDYDHWIAFILLVFIGSKMIYESFKIKDAQEKSQTMTTATLLILAMATSIDALAVGFTFSFLLAGSLFLAVAIIGLITFIICYAGFYIGNRIGHIFENRIEILGGLILIAIGFKILLT